jgi:RNA polymerase-binding transcription factor DksA
VQFSESGETVDTSVARSRLEEQLAQLQSDDRALLEERAPADLHVAHLSQHPADYGTELSDAEREDAVRGAVEREIAQIKQALQRIDEGTYGTCIVCGKKIPDERLEARPEAIRCIEHQQEYEATFN